MERSLKDLDKLKYNKKGFEMKGKTKDLGYFEMFGKSFHGYVTFPEPPSPLKAWLDEHRILNIFRLELEKYQEQHLKDVIVKLSNGKEVRFHCCSVSIPGFEPSEEKTSIMINQNYAFGGTQLTKYDIDEWETYQHVPCEFSWQLIRVKLDWLCTFINSIIYWDCLYRVIVKPFKQLIFNTDRCNFRWNKVNNYVVMEVIKLREDSFKKWKAYDSKYAEMVYKNTTELYNRLTSRDNLKECNATINAINKLDYLNKRERAKLWDKLNRLKNKWSLI